jgi:serine/threonine protein kinase
MTNGDDDRTLQRDRAPPVIPQTDETDRTEPMAASDRPGGREQSPAAGEDETRELSRTANAVDDDATRKLDRTVITAAGDDATREWNRTIPAVDDDATRELGRAAIAADDDATREYARTVPVADDDETRVRGPDILLGDGTAVRESRDGDAAITLARGGLVQAGENGTTVARGDRGRPAGVPADLVPGYRLRNRYILIEPIGQGAMGQVWKARDELSEKAQDRNPFVAIKVFRGDFANHPDAFVAMQREASRAMQLAHPNIITVHNFDQDERSGRTFIVMELLKGRPLDRLIRDAHGEGVNRKDAWTLIRGMSEGLAYAHRKGYVHSDFKPGNVFLTSDGVAKVLDFGIARAVRQVDASPHTHVDAGAGAEEDADDSVMFGYTAIYAAPEMIEEQPPDTSDDVYGLGLVAYEVLTGRHPFDRLPANRAREARLRPQPIKGLTARQWRALEKALSFTREKRFPNAAAFLRSLQGLTVIQKALVAAVAVLSVVTGGLAYRNHLNNLPREPLSALPAAEQQVVIDALQDGRQALRLIRDERIMEASEDAVNAFAKAYQHHPKDPDAVAGLREAADLFVRWCDGLPDQQDALAKLLAFQAHSDYYLGYRPLMRAIQKRQAK